MAQSSSGSDRKLFVLNAMKARLLAMEGEEMWCAGHAPADNRDVPPNWVKNAIERMSREIPIQPGALSRPAEITPEDRGRIAGFVEATWISINSPSKETKREEAAGPGLKEWRSLFEVIAAKMKFQESELARVQPEPGARKTALEVDLYHKGGREAAKFVTSGAAMSMKAELCFWMWLFWPQVEALGSREKVHSWISEMRFVSCSFKLFEKLCQEIGYRPSGTKS
jgi:hypothetical protein